MVHTVSEQCPPLVPDDLPANPGPQHEYTLISLSLSKGESDPSLLLTKRSTVNVPRVPG